MESAMEHVIVCRCEEVTLQHIRETALKYNCSAREIKLRTRAAMGCCGGRTCRSTIDRIIGDISTEGITDEIPLSYRPPVRPVTFGILGGMEDGQG